MLATAPVRAAKPGDVAVATKAVIRVAERLGLTNRELARILGISEATISRLRNGVYFIRREHKEFELAILLARLYRSLDAIVGGEDAVARDWLRNHNHALRERPIELIQTLMGLTDVIRYLDARRASV